MLCSKKVFPAAPGKSPSSSTLPGTFAPFPSNGCFCRRRPVWRLVHNSQEKLGKACWNRNRRIRGKRLNRRRDRFILILHNRPRRARLVIGFKASGFPRFPQIHSFHHHNKG
jgi:hypothetical protein